MIQRPTPPMHRFRRPGHLAIAVFVTVALAACQSTSSTATPPASTPAPAATAAAATAPSPTAPSPTAPSPAENAGAGALPPLPDIPVYKATPGRTGVQPGPGPATKPVEVWSRSLECLVGSHTAVLVSGLLIEPCDGSTLTALDARTGEVRWTADLKGQALDPVVSDGVIYIGSTAGTFHALDLATGASRWTVDLKTDRLPVVVDGRVYVGTGDGRYVGLDVADGAVAWSWTSPVLGDVITRGTVSDGMAYLSGTGMLYAVDIAAGTTTWTYATTGDRFAAPVVDKDDVIVSSQPTGPIAVLDRATGKERWRFTSPSGQQVAPPSVADGLIVSPSADGILYAFDRATGDIRWQVDAGPMGGQAAAVAGDLVYFTLDRSVRAVDAGTGATRWELDLGADVDNSSLVSGGMLFTGDNSGMVRAFAAAGTTGALAQPAASPTAAPQAAAGLAQGLELAATFDPSTTDGLDQPSGIAAGPDGNLYVVNALKDEIVVLDPADGSVVRRWGTSGSEPGQFNFLRSATDPGSAIGGVATGRDGTVFVADTVNRRVQAFAPDGTFIRSWGRFGPENGQFLEPIDVATGPDGDVYVVDDQRDDIQRFTADGTWVATIGRHGTGPGELNFTSGIAVGPDGTLYNADWENKRAQAWDSTGAFLWSFDGRDSQSGILTTPSDVAADADGRVYVTDVGRLQVLDASPSVVATLKLDNTDVTNLAVSGDTVFVSEPFLNRILKLRVLR